MPTLSLFDSALHFQVWVLLIVMCMCYGFFIYAVERKDDPDADFPENHYAAFRETAWHAAMMSFQTRDKPITTAAGKVATVTYAFIMLIMLSAYTANLAATMSSERIPEVVKGFEQLKTKVASVYCGGATEQYMIKNNVAGRILCKYSDSDAASAVEERAADAAVMNRLQAAYIAAQSCNVHVVPGISIDSKPYALPVQKGWIADYAQFNRWLVELVMDGTVERLETKWFHGIGTCQRTKSAKLDIDNFYGVGLVMLMGIVGAVFILIGQTYYEQQMLTDDSDYKAVGQ